MAGSTLPIPPGASNLPPPASRSAVLALAAATASGAGMAVQTYVNGQLGASVGSPLAAAVINNAIAVGLLMLFALATGGVLRAIRNLRDPARRVALRPWHFAAGAIGGLYLVVGAASAVTIGVAIFSISAIFGQLFGGLVSDRFGLSPAGIRTFTRPRVLGTCLGLAAVAIAGVGAGGSIEPWLVAAAIAIGASAAVQQAAMGHVSVASGVPPVAASINSTCGIAIVLAIALALAAAGHGQPLDLGASSPPEWLGGLIAAAILATVATVVRTLGLLVLALALVSGQAVGSLVVDLVAPAAGASVTPATAAGVLLAIAAMAVTVLGDRPRVRWRAAQTGAE